MKTLGLDLGTNSLGWAVIDWDAESNPIAHKGVVVFEEGVNREQSDSLETPAATRRKYRLARRLRFRRYLRRHLVLMILIEQKMCPLTKEELKAWAQKGTFPKENAAFVEWLKSTDTRNPYCDRARAATEKVDPLTLGRAIYHLAQRRGFKSGRKDQPVEGEENSVKAKELKGLLKEIGDLTEKLTKTGLTLGQHFFNEIKAGRKVRKQHTGRIEHYEKEFETIANVQGLHEKIIQWKDQVQPLSAVIARALFWQRPLREQSHLVGKCPLESKRNRAQIGHPDFEEFRVLSFVNNIRLVSGKEKTELDDKERNAALECLMRNINRIHARHIHLDDESDIQKIKIPLTSEERDVAVECFITNERGKPRDEIFKFKVLGNVLRRKFPELKGAVFNFEDNVSLSPSKVTAALRDVLPDGSDRQKAFDALIFFDRFVDCDEKLKAWAQLNEIQRKDKHGNLRESSKGLGLSEEAAEKFIKIHIPEGRASYSLHAIRKILPFLRKGIELSKAIFLAKCPDVLRDFTECEDTFIEELDRINEDYRKDKKNAERQGLKPEHVPTLEERRRDWFAKKVKKDCNGKVNDPFETLYFRDPKADSSYATLCDKEWAAADKGVLPEVKLGMIRNPLVQRSMTMLRRLVNELHRKGIIDKDTSIHIELAHEVNDRNRRMAIQEWQKQNEKDKAEAKAKLEDLGIQPTDTDILKYVLATEQNWKCPYTGKSIPINGGGSLFPGFDIEHTIPRSRSGDDSQANKTLCDSDYNRNVKKGRIPTECPNYEEACGDYPPISVMISPWKAEIDRLKKLKEEQRKKTRSIKENPDARSKARQKMLITEYDLKYWGDKYYRFTKKSDDVTSSFISRQLVDTGIMTRHAVALLKTVYSDVNPVNGQAVAFARKLWKVQAADETKDRSDHTHHAKDAVVIAALSRDRFQKICTELKADDERKNPQFTIPPPLDGFAQAVHDATATILIKHVTRHNELKQTLRKSIRLSSPKKTKGDKIITRAKTGGDTVRGQLHNDSFYGCIQDPENGGAKTYVIRKELKFDSQGFANKEADFESIVDKTIREHLLAEVRRRMRNGCKNFKEALDIGNFTMPSGVPIKKVRIYAHVANPKRLRQHTDTPSTNPYKQPYWVQATSGSNFRLAVYKRCNELGMQSEPRFVAENILDYVQGKIESSGNPPIGYILPGAMAIAYKHDGEWRERGFDITRRLYKVVKFAKSKSNNKITLRFHKEARRMKDLSSELAPKEKKSYSGASSLDFEKQLEPLYLLTLENAWSSFLFEGIHFKMDLDGTIHFKENLC